MVSPGVVPSPFTRELRNILRTLFFFQAEDGIRDVAVTGVQTCALPICKRGVKGEKIFPHSGAGKISGDFLQNLVTEVTNKKKKKNKYNNNNNYK